MRRLAALGAALAFAAGAAAQTVHGRILRATSYGIYPVPSLAVTLSSPQRGRSATAYTGQDGGYVFYNVPPGRYSLEMWTGRSPVSAPIDVFNRPLTELPPYTLR